MLQLRIMTTSKGVDSALNLIGLTGFAGISLVAPNAMQALSLLLRKTATPPSDYARIMKELRRQKLIEIFINDNEVVLALSPAGAYRLAKNTVDEIQIPKLKNWDKKWRMVMFDIPVGKSTSRKYFTSHLGNLDFYMLQRSTWIHPHPCFEQIAEIAGFYNVMRYCSFIEISNLDDLTARKLVHHFSPILKS